MIPICWRLVEILSRVLEPGEREAVRGDLAESGETAGQSLRDLLGLVIRRQAALWKDWRPWLALIAFVGPVGILLMQFLLFVSRGYELYFWIIRNYRVMDPALLDQTGLTLRHGIVVLTCDSFLLMSWSWTGGRVLGFLSRQTIWVNGLLFCLVWLFLSSGQRSSTPKPFTFLFALPLIWGVRQGLRLGAPRLRQAIFWAIAITSMTVLAIWTGSWWRGGAWWSTIQLPLSLALNWPAWYMVAKGLPRSNNT